MRIDRTALHGLALAAIIAGAVPAQADNAATGVWIDHTGRGAVEITDCDGKLCGYVAWVQDTKNSDQCGKQIIGDVRLIGKNKWDNGWIYDPDSDKRYDVELTPTGSDTLKVVGYAGTKWLSKSFTWKRAPADLQTCNDGAARDASNKTPGKPDTAAAAVPSDAGKAPDRASASRSDSNADAKDDNSSVARNAPDAAAKSRTDEDAGDSFADDEPAKGEGKRVVSRIMERLEAGDTPVKVTRKGNTCKMSVPYVDMVISIPCED